MSRVTSQLKKKGFLLDPLKVKRARRVLGTTTEAETIDRALDEIIEEDKRSKRAWKTHDRFLNSDILIDDVYGNLKA